MRGAVLKGIHILFIPFMIATLIWLQASTGRAQSSPEEQAGPNVEWFQGTGVLNLGDNVAEIDVGSGYIYIEGPAARKMLEWMGTPSTGLEVGLITPSNAEMEWFALFEWHPTGYVKDVGKVKINAEAVLGKIREATEKANEYRLAKGAAPVNVIDWYAKPQYDGKEHNLAWAILVEEQGGAQSVNYYIYLLGRRGYISATLVADPGVLDLLKGEITGLLKEFSFKPGQKYTDYRPGDMVADNGLTFLISAEPPVVAAKSGYFGFLAVAGTIAFLIVFSVIYISAARKKNRRTIGRRYKSRLYD